jgi:hypothetical protein
LHVTAHIHALAGAASHVTAHVHALASLASHYFSTFSHSQVIQPRNEVVHCRSAVKLVWITFSSCLLQVSFSTLCMSVQMT